MHENKLSTHIALCIVQLKALGVFHVGVVLQHCRHRLFNDVWLGKLIRFKGNKRDFPSILVILLPSTNVDILGNHRCTHLIPYLCDTGC